MVDLGQIRACSFDCYGTLIDWQSGLLAALRARGVELSEAEVFRRFAEGEAEAERPPYRPYRRVLEQVAAEYFGPDAGDADRECLWRSIGAWPAFAETPGAMASLKRRFGLAVVSNVDDDLFELTRPKLGAALDEVVTAEQVRSYKPGRAHFDELLRRLGLRAGQVLHIAESRRHDIAPARELGFWTVWVDRARGGVSASGEGDAEPHLRVGSLMELVERVERGG